MFRGEFRKTTRDKVNGSGVESDTKRGLDLMMFSGDLPYEERLDLGDR